MQPDLAPAAGQRSAGRPVGYRKPAPPTTTDKMTDSLMIWRVDLDRPDAVRGLLLAAGFGAIEVAALADIAVAAARKRRFGRR